VLATSVFEDVLQIRLCRYPEFVPAATVSVYLVDGLLVDSGPAHTAEELTDFLSSKRITIAVNTHFHEDHIAGNKFLQDRFGLTICAPPLAMDQINKPASLYPYQEEVWGYPVPSQVFPLGTTIRTEKYSFEVLSTPGHDRDHVCLFEPGRRWLFSGDLFIGRKPTVCRPMDDQWQIIEDLKTIRSLNPRLLFPAPSRVILEPCETLESVIAYLESLGRRIEVLYEKGRTVSEIRLEVFGEEDPISKFTQNQFSTENMVRSFLKMNS
jgi:glyoxylase-like metal-dependent hydrolase (beta-lactamase superfamily II)